MMNFSLPSTIGKCNNKTYTILFPKKFGHYVKCKLKTEFNDLQILENLYLIEYSTYMCFKFNISNVEMSCLI